MFDLDQAGELPDLYLVEQKTVVPKLDDTAAALNQQLDGFRPLQKVRAGDRIAIAGSSRGIQDLALILKELVVRFKQLGAKPVIAPAMGAQGGGTAQGQAEILRVNGISEETLCAPVVSSTATEEIGRTRDGFAVMVGRDFIQADHVVVVNRIKPHTDMFGDIESGLLKMMVIGMGKVSGAITAHKAIIHQGFQEVVKEFSSIIFENLSILMGIGVVENQYHQTAYLKVIEPEAMISEEKTLLRKAKRLVAKIPFDQVDLLVVDVIGKNIAGPGMDTRVIGRVMNIVTREPPRKKFKRVFVRDLTKETRGNACGIGLADFTTDRLVAGMDREVTKANTALTCTPEKAKIPIAFPNDHEGVVTGLHSAGVFRFTDARIVWIKNTLELQYLTISKALLDDAAVNPKLEIAKGPFHFPFDEAGNLPFNTFRLP